MILWTVHFEKIVVWKEKSVLIESKGEKIWLPKKPCTFFKGDYDYKVLVPDWLFRKSKLSDWDYEKKDYKHDVEY